MDQASAPPNAAAAFTQILQGGGQSVAILADGTKIPLEEAISKKMIAVSGSEISPQDLAQRLYQQSGNREYAESTAAIYDQYLNLPPIKFYQFLRTEDFEGEQILGLMEEFKAIRESGTHKEVVFANLTDQPIRLDVQENIVVGADGHDANHLPNLKGIEASTELTPHEIQLKLWTEGNGLKTLGDLGYVGGPKGTPQSALVRFQEDYGISGENGELGPLSLRALVEGVSPGSKGSVRALVQKSPPYNRLLTAIAPEIHASKGSVRALVQKSPPYNRLLTAIAPEIHASLRDRPRRHARCECPRKGSVHWFRKSRATLVC